MSNYEQRNHDFSKGMAAAQFSYIEAESRVVELEAENAKLRKLLQDVAICACGRYCYGCPHQYDGCDRDKRLKAEGIEVDE